MILYKRRKSKNELLNSVLDTIYSVAEYGSFTEDLVNILVNSEKKIEVSFQVKMDDGSIQTFRGAFVQHSTVLGPSIGSIEILNNGSMQECEALAMLMSLHAAMLGLPMGGSKGIIFADTEKMSKDETERLYKAYIDAISDFLKKNTNTIKLLEDGNAYAVYPIIDIVEKKTHSIKSVVNRPNEYFSTGMIEQSQAFSVAQCVKKVLENYKREDIPNLDVGITLDDEKADINLLIELNNLGLKILGFATDEEDNIKIYRKKIWDLIFNTDWSKTKCIKCRKIDPYEKTDNENILEANVDVLILQDSEVFIDSENAQKIKAKYIIEASENLITHEAEVVLEDRGSLVIPDFISLGGVLLNAYLEWIYGSSAPVIGSLLWKNTVAKLLQESLTLIFEIKNKHKITTREAAILYAISRIIDIKQKKGFN